MVVKQVSSNVEHVAKSLMLSRIYYITLQLSISILKNFFKCDYCEKMYVTNRIMFTNRINSRGRERPLWDKEHLKPVWWHADTPYQSPKKGYKEPSLRHLANWHSIVLKIAK